MKAISPVRICDLIAIHDMLELNPLDPRGEWETIFTIERSGQWYGWITFKVENYYISKQYSQVWVRRLRYNDHDEFVVVTNWTPAGVGVAKIGDYCQFTI